jgi:DNA-binding transcriptional MerR regulator
MKPETQLYKPAEACRIAEVAPYVLRYWETEFSALAEGKEKGGGARLYSSRDVRIISRIRELLYEEGFTVAGAKKRLEAEMQEGRFDDGEPAPPLTEQRSAMKKSASTEVAVSSAAPPVPQSSRIAEPEPAPRKAAASPRSDLPERKQVIRELKEIARLLERPKRR